jgi:alpha,alpha-trehalase
MPAFRLVLLCSTILALGCATSRPPHKAPDSLGAEVKKPATEADLAALRHYIRQSWHTLRRSNQDLLKAAVDPKHPPANGKWPVYISSHDDVHAVRQALTQELPLSDLQQLELRRLGSDVPRQHGILYLPHPYVVPGGRFNEMYGWDSYFIIRGLLQDEEVALAKNMADNFLYEVTHYGSILNANRTYYLTRSQPPFLTRIVLEVFHATRDLAWLKAALPVMLAYHNTWLMPPHLTDSGLSRYYDTGAGPAPEVVSGEIDAKGQGAYDRIRAYYKTHAVPDYDLPIYYDKAKDQLTDLFYRADRSMRESGFDPSARFGPFNAGILEHNPVCLNSLLYAAEMDLVQIYKILGDENEASAWASRAEHRATLINSMNWDDERGLYFDYDFTEGKRRDYPFATTFYPLWAGVASHEQAQRLVDNLPLFEAPGGLLTSPNRSGNQWDAPYGWAPLQQLAIEGLRRYDYRGEADRLSIAFLSMLLADFKHTHAMFEKYNVAERHSDTAGLKFGYTSNEVGFGWTNSAFINLYEQLSDSAKAQVLDRAR